MASAGEYRAKANEFHAKAEAEPSLDIKIQLATLARAYEHLAGQAERNTANDIVYETPPPPAPPAAE